MSLHRRCCCVSGECTASWGSCADPLKLSVIGMNIQRKGIACDGGSLACPASWAGLEIIEDLNASLTDIEYEWVPPSGGTPGRYVVRPAASNGGTVTVSLSCAGDPHPYNTVAFGACSSTWTPLGSGSFTTVLSTPDPDQSFEIDGTIESKPFWNGSAWECRFVLTLFLTSVYYDRYDVDVLTNLTSGTHASVVGTSLKMTHRVIMTATAPHSGSACPHDQTWTIETMNHSISLGDADTLLMDSGIPEPAIFTDCPVGAAVDCVTPGDCHYNNGYDNAMGPNMTNLFEMSGFVQWSNDTPTMSLTA